MYGITRSMSRAGTPTDNAAMEAINGWIKAELFMDLHVTGEKPVQNEIDDYILFFNEQRPAYSLNYLTPKQYRESNSAAVTAWFPAFLILIFQLLVSNFCWPVHYEQIYPLIYLLGIWKPKTHIDHQNNSLMIDVRQIFEEIETPALSVRAGIRNRKSDKKCTFEST